MSTHGSVTTTSTGSTSTGTTSSTTTKANTSVVLPTSAIAGWLTLMLGSSLTAEVFGDTEPSLSRHRAMLLSYTAWPPMAIRLGVLSFSGKSSQAVLSKAKSGWSRDYHRDLSLVKKDHSEG